MSSIIIKSFAKLNLTLDVMSVRSDGFHSIASIMQTISLADQLDISLTKTSGIEFCCNAEGIPSDISNHSFKAAHLFAEAFSIEQGISIRLNKTVPSQAGLGGGSANAGYTLLGLCQLFDIAPVDKSIHAIASEIGSDVPFFLTGGTAVARGRGEMITPIVDLPLLYFVVVKPHESVSTGAAYSALDSIADRQSVRGTMRMEAAVVSGDIDQIISRLSNDFESVILEKYPVIAEVFDDFWMARAANVRLCGSGAAVFGVCRTLPEAEYTARLMRLKYSEVHVCSSVNRQNSFDFQVA